MNSESRTSRLTASFSSRLSSQLSSRFASRGWSALCLAMGVATSLLLPFAAHAVGGTAVGTGASFGLGNYNSAFGFDAFFTGGTGNNNTATGAYSLYFNNLGNDNTATGYQSLYNFSGQGGENVAIGSGALFTNQASFNVATGFQSLYKNTTGPYNVADGAYALYFNSTGSDNVANGYQALYNNTTASGNVGIGYQALTNNTTGGVNTAVGMAALTSNTLGTTNAAFGPKALASNTTGNNNVGIGPGALDACITGNSNIALGFYAGQSIALSNNIDIGNNGLGTDNGAIRIGTSGTHTSAYIAGISGVTVAGGIPVYINTSGQLGTIVSSRRFKHDIKDMGDVTDKLMSLRPVTFKYNDSVEKGKHERQYGLIAEEVAKVYPDLAVYDKEGRAYSVAYQLLAPMLLNEVQKSHKQMEAQKTEIARLKAVHDADHAEIAKLKANQDEKIARLTADIATLKQAVADHATTHAQTLSLHR